MIQKQRCQKIRSQDNLRNVILVVISLIIVLKIVMDDSMEVTREVLNTWHTDRNIRKKYHHSPLQDLLVNLASLLETPSQESQDLEKEKGKQTNQVSYNPSSTEFPSTPRSSQPRYPISYETPDNKHEVSEASLETRSGLTTPKLLLQPEAKIQALQKDFIGVILNKVYDGHVSVHWARGRHMHLSYHECVPLHRY
jgi:hypothetical protein